MLQFYDFEVKKKLNKELRKEQALGGWGTTQTRSSSWERMLKVRAACKKTTHTHHTDRETERETRTHTKSGNTAFLGSLGRIRLKPCWNLPSLTPWQPWFLKMET